MYTEICPHCDNEVVLEKKELVFKCPNCGKWTVLCSICKEKYDCNNCELEKVANELNNEQ